MFPSSLPDLPKPSRTLENVQKTYVLEPETLYKMSRKNSQILIVIPD